MKIAGICPVSSSPGVLAGAGPDCVADDDQADDSLRAAVGGWVAA